MPRTTSKSEAIEEARRLAKQTGRTVYVDVSGTGGEYGTTYYHVLQSKADGAVWSVSPKGSVSTLKNKGYR